MAAGLGWAGGVTGLLGAGGSMRVWLAGRSWKEETVCPVSFKPQLHKREATVILLPSLRPAWAPPPLPGHLVTDPGIRFIFCLGLWF